MDKESKLELLEFDSFNNYKEVHLFYFFKKNSDIFLLLKNKIDNSMISAKSNEDNLGDYEEFFTSNDPVGNSPIISLARYLSLNYMGLFTENILKKIRSHKKLNFNDFEYLNFENNIYPERTSNCFYDHILKFSDNIIQFDRIKNKIIYFYELEPFDIDFLNENMEQLNQELMDDYENINNDEIKLLFNTRFILVNINDILNNKNIKHNIETPFLNGMPTANNCPILYNFCINSRINGLIANNIDKALDLQIQNNSIAEKNNKNYINKSYKASNFKINYNTIWLLNEINAENYIKNFKNLQKNKIIFLDIHNEYNNSRSDSLRFLLYFSLFSGIYRTADEIWIHKKPFEDEFLNPQTIMNDKSYKSIIIPGSNLHLYSVKNYLFLKKATQFIKGINNCFQDIENYRNKNLRILGVCFGHQLIAFSFGSEVKKRPSGHFFFQTEKIKLDMQDEADFQIINFLKNLSKEKLFQELYISEAHSDEVSNPPENMRVIGFSDSCANEILISKDKRILTFQGHPEYTAEYQYYKSCTNKFDVGKIKEMIKLKEIYCNRYYINYPYSDFFRKVTYGFIKQEYN